VTVTVQGSAAHASEPEAGENAIYRAADAIDVLRSLDSQSAYVPPVDREVTGSLVVTETHGGTAWNVVPDECVITVDERTVGEKRASVDRVEDLDGVEYTVDQDLPAMVCADTDFADAVLDAARAVGPGHPEAVTKPHATDAGWLSRAGTTCVVCGPAERGEAHTGDESVSVDGLRRCVRLYRTIAETGW
jgi:acetylornithine deacetylase